MTDQSWAGCDNEAQEEIRYAIGNYMDVRREVMASAKGRGLTAIAAKMQLNIDTARAALMVLEDLADGTLVTTPRSEAPRPGSYGAGKGPTSEAKDAFVAEMGAPPSSEMQCVKCREWSDCTQHEWNLCPWCCHPHDAKRRVRPTTAEAEQ
jgi:hypothetical protein